jgi:hypothetical protein
MDIAFDDKLTTFILEGLDGRGDPQPELVVRLAMAFPDIRALELTLALAAAAEGLDAVIAGGGRVASVLYRMATLVAVDTLVLEVRGWARDHPITARHLLMHWQDDPFFGRNLGNDTIA